MKNKRIIAIYLPQFHPIVENDQWWGKGFTEWTNVTKAKPRFRGHYQPHLPADLGFYDLRLEQTREEQASLAKEYGVDGFCYYHYWFNGKRLLNTPLDEILRLGKPDFPFMLCWANENWTRAWDGNTRKVLMEQNYSPEDDLEHIRFLLKVFKDSRYIRVDGKPMFSVYRASLFPNISKTIELWRTEARKEGLELYLCRFESGGESGDSVQLGFDASVEFQPHTAFANGFMKFRNLPTRIINRLSRDIFKEDVMMNSAVSYKKYVDHMIEQSRVPYKQFPCVTPMWDNSPRKKVFFAFKDSTPELYKKWLKDTLNKFTPYSKEENFVFINAWNEWAEGNHLEPCQKWERKYLEVTKEAIEEDKEK